MYRSAALFKTAMAKMAAIGPASFLLPSLFLSLPSPFICSFRPSLSAFALFVRISAVTVAHLGDISKKERLVTNEQMTRGTEGTAIGAHCALNRHYARRVYLERNAFARIVAKEWLFCYIAPFIWKKREIAERSEGRMGETNDGGKTREQARARRA